MPYYIKQGKIPRKRHVTFYRDDGELFREELFSTHGFSNIYSNRYHYNMPTKVFGVEALNISHGEEWSENLIQNYKINTCQNEKKGNFFESRCRFLFNDDVSLYTALVTEDTHQFYRNAYADEVIFVHEGCGTFKSDYGDIEISKWDYIVIPKGTTYQLKFDGNEAARLFVIESPSMITIPAQFRTETGQLLESAPYCERDIRTPELQEPVVKKGEFELIVKYGDNYQKSMLEWHPFDLAGWDGACYPLAININDYAPKVGQIHLPPSEHLIFSANNFVVCNFVPRLYDFHSEAIPAPYYHTNIDSEEVLYYIDGQFMSRTDIQPGSLTLHKKGVPHGPQPGKTEESVGQDETHEYALMVDTFNPLKLTEHFKNCMTSDYNQSWLENDVSGDK